MTLVGFEPTISAGELPQTYALDRAATVTGVLLYNIKNLEGLLTCAFDRRFKTYHLPVRTISWV